MLNSEDETNTNLIDIEELTCPLGEVLVSNTSLGDGYDSIRTVLNPNGDSNCDADVVDEVAIGRGDGVPFDHQHPDEISVIADRGATHVSGYYTTQSKSETGL